MLSSIAYLINGSFVMGGTIIELCVIDHVQNPSYPPFAKGGIFSDHSYAGSPLFKGGLGGICKFLNTKTILI